MRHTRENVKGKEIFLVRPKVLRFSKLSAQTNIYIPSSKERKVKIHLAKPIKSQSARMQNFIGKLEFHYKKKTKPHSFTYNICIYIKEISQK